jgi:membrane protease YdiL (CAAX protease family)
LVLVGPAEEFLYRGAMQGQLRTVFGPAVSIGLPAVLFGLFHVPNYVFAGVSLTSAGMWFSLFVIAASGAVFGYLFERTDNLAVPILSHPLLNVVFISLTIATGV